MNTLLLEKNYKKNSRILKISMQKKQEKQPWKRNSRQNKK